MATHRALYFFTPFFISSFDFHLSAHTSAGGIAMVNRLLGMLTLALLLANVSTETALGQYPYNTWYFGYEVGLSFDTAPPTILTDGKISTLEGCSVICDQRTGAIKLYTDGTTVWNARHEEMPNGDSLMGHYTSTQSAIIVPKPCDPDIYYIFTAGAGFYHIEDPTKNGFRYSIVDMRLDGGLGDVVEKNVELLAWGQSSEIVSAVHDGAEGTFWILAHGLDNNYFVAYRLTDQGLSAPVVSRVGGFLGRVRGSQSLAKFSHDGKMVALTTPSDKRLQLFDFDIATGRLSNARDIGTDAEYYGVEFSPDNRMLYSSTVAIDTTLSFVFQFDLRGGSADMIRNSRFALDTINGLSVGGQCQLGPDGKIYVTIAKRSTIGVVNDPNARGFACNYVEDQITFAGQGTSYGLPSVISAYRGDPDRMEDLDLRFLVDKDEAQIGDVVTYTLIVCNSRDTGITDALARITLAAGLTPLDGPSSLQRNIPLLRAGECDTLICRAVVTATNDEQTLRSCGEIETPTRTVCRIARQTLCLDLVAYACLAPLSVDVAVGGHATGDSEAGYGLCSGSTLTLTAAVRPDLPGIRYRWSPAESLDCDTCAATTGRPTATTRYIVTASLSGGCVGRDTVDVIVTPGEKAHAGADSTICPGESVRIGTTVTDTNLSIRWTPSTFLSDPTIDRPVVTPMESISYTLTVVDTLTGCTSYDTIAITVEPAPRIDTVPDQTICRGGATLLRVTPSASGAGYRYRWSPATGLDCDTCAEVTARPATTTTYEISVTNEAGCTTRDSATIAVIDAEFVDAGEDRSVCLGQDVRIGATDLPELRYAWTPATGLDDPTAPRPNASPLVSTLYTLRAVDTISGCIALDSVRVDVVAPPMVDAGEEREICAGERTEIGAAQGEPGTTYRWTPIDGLDDPTSPTPIASPTRTTIYHLTALDTVTGCSAIDSMTVTVAEPRRLSAWIDRDYHGASGEPVTIAVESDPIPVDADIDSLEIEITYDGEIMRLDDESIDLSGTPLDGWTVTILDHRAGTLRLQAIAPPGRTLDGGGELLRFDVRMFLSLRLESELGLEITADAVCLSIVESPGLVRHDTVCGLNFRLIELSLIKYAAPRAVPNPARGVVSVEFAVGLDGATRLEIYDAMGRYVGTLVEGELGPGAYAVEWDVSGLGAGAYHLRLTSGAWEGQGRALVD